MPPVAAVTADTLQPLVLLPGLRVLSLVIKVPHMAPSLCIIPQAPGLSHPPHLITNLPHKVPGVNPSLAPRLLPKADATVLWHPLLRLAGLEFPLYWLDQEYIHRRLPLKSKTLIRAPGGQPVGAQRPSLKRPRTGWRMIDPQMGYCTPAWSRNGVRDRS